LFLLKDVDYTAPKAAEAKEVQQPKAFEEKNKLLFFRSTNLESASLLDEKEDGGLVNEWNP
jgi:hypothetical protein